MTVMLKMYSVPRSSFTGTITKFLGRNSNPAEFDVIFNFSLGGDS